MITVAVLAVLLAIAAPSFNDAVLGSRLGSHANNFAAGALTARSEAIKRNAVITLCASTDGATCATTGGWEQGWIVMCNTSGDNLCDAAGTGTLVMQREQRAANGLQITETSTPPRRTLSFQPTGVGATPALLTICRSAPSAGATERVVAISATGRPTVTRTSAASCPTM